MISKYRGNLALDQRRLLKNDLRVGIIGFGVVGSATASGLKYLNHDVYINDVKNLDEYKREFNVLKPYDLSSTDVTLLALPTPTVPLTIGGEIDLSILESVVEDLGKKLSHHNDYHVFVVRSTVPPGTTRRLGKRLEEISSKKMNYDFGMAMNPEFLRAFNSFDDFKNAKVTVIGESDEKTGDLVEKIYTPLNSEIRRVGLEEAEMIKYAHNLFNATKISYFNELWKECKHLGIDFEDVRRTIVKTSEACFNPEYGSHGGLPYGGTCLPKDTVALHSYLKEHGFSPRILEAVILVNNSIQNMNGAARNPYFRRRMHETYDNLKRK